MSDAILGKHHFLSRLRAGKIDEKTETTYLKTNIALKFKVLQIKINLHEQELHMQAIIIRNYFKNTAGVAQTWESLKLSYRQFANTR